MRKTALQRLLRSTHSAVFDKAPMAELALKLRDPGGAAWSIADEVMTARAGAGAQHDYDLSALTIGQLAAALRADGFDVDPVTSEWSDRSAMVLAEASGNSGESNGDRVGAFTSLLWVLMSGYAREVIDAEYQVKQALRQMVIPQAEGEWLDLWAALYGVQRLPGETDQHLATRIPQEAFRQRVNALAIEKAIFDQTGWDVRIEEPWRDVFRLDESLLSGPHKFYDGERIGYHLIQPTTNEQVDWAVVNAIIERNRPAGVLVLSPVVRHTAHVDADYARDVFFGVSREHVEKLVYEDRPLLDVSLVLDDGDSIILNHAARHRQELLRSSIVVFDDQGFVGAFEIHSKHTRGYRTHYLALDYRSQTWTNRRSWRTAADTWSGLTAVIDSKHTSES